MESKFLTLKQIQILHAYGYTLTFQSDQLEVWRINNNELMIDFWHDGKNVQGVFWITEETTKTFSPKRLQSFLKKWLKNNN